MFLLKTPLNENFNPSYTLPHRSDGSEVKDIKSSSFEASYSKLYSLIQEEFMRHFEEIDIDSLNFLDKLNYMNILDGKATQQNIENSLSLLSKLLSQKYNQSVVILSLIHI